MNNIFPYVMNREKTYENLISGIGCSPDTVLSEFTFVKKQFKKEDGRTYVHIIQAFSSDDEITPETAHEIGLRFAEYPTQGSNPSPALQVDSLSLCHLGTPAKLTYM